ncbi:MAG TPA: uracil-DNA glycosylase, partial [Candidatus Krumholzibacterium sp.]|nr:uracil-DNA glycosylase [Candidatus Krumholzibacterium sp.]
MSSNTGDITGEVIKYFHRRISSGTGTVYRVGLAGEEEILLRTSPEEEVAVPKTGKISSMDMEQLSAAVSACRRCPLAESRTNTVFGDGNPEARIVFVGEAPGRDEDLQGVPFVGRAGKLLDKMIAAIGFSREDVYIANILKCRPPNNRDPLEEEVVECEAYLERQIELIDPLVICALGRVAAQNLLKTKASLKVLREGVHYYNDTRMVITYHPAALLR